MKRKKLNIGVVGIGYLGKYHLEKFINNKKCDTKWVVDTNLDNINLNGHDSIQKSSNYKEILDDIDAVSLVTPTKMHFKIAKFFLENKKHVLIEKPMTETVAQATKLVDLAKKKDRLNTIYYDKINDMEDHSSKPSRRCCGLLKVKNAHGVAACKVMQAPKKHDYAVSYNDL